MRVAIASGFGCSLSWALRLIDEGHDVKTWLPSDDGDDIVHVGDGLVPKEPRWENLVAWAREGADAGEQVIVLFDASGMGEKADACRKLGLHVVGGGTFADRLEKDRLFGQGIAEAAGCVLPEYEEFASLSEAQAWAKTAKGDGFYFKSDSYINSDATYGAKDAEDLYEYLAYLKTQTRNRINCIIQHKIDGVALSTARWWNGKTWVGPYEGTIEHKKFMNDDIGPSTGCSFNAVWYYPEDEPAIAKALGWEKLASAFVKNEASPGIYDINCIIGDDKKAYYLEWTPRCYSSDTEVLTYTGWRPMRDVVVGELVASLTDDKELVFVPVEATISKHHEGEMVRVKSNTYDLLVTPDHAMTFKDAKGDLFSLEAGKIGVKQLRTVRSATWIGVDIPFYTIPAHVEIHKTGRHHGSFEIIHEARTVPMETWCKFMALYLSNGHIHVGKGNPYQVYIAEMTLVPEVRSVLDALGFKHSYHDHSFCISSVQLAQHLFSIVGRVRAPTKRVPRFILDLAPKYLEAFLDGYSIGDGSTHKRTGQRTWTSCSKGMAEDLHEIVLRCGRWASIKNVGPGKYPGSIHDMRVVAERSVKVDGRVFGKRHTSREWYDGEVVCLTVPHHRLYVRRPDGPSMWCGNCGYDSEMTSFRLMDDLGAALWAIATGEGGSDCDMDLAYSVRLTVPPYPHEAADYSIPKSWDQVMVRGDVGDLWSGNFIGYQLELGDLGLQLASPEGIIGLALATGKNLSALGDECNEFAKESLRVPGLQRRTDGHECVAKDAKQISAAGFPLPKGLEK